MAVRPDVGLRERDESAKDSPECNQVFEHDWRRSLFVPRHLDAVVDYRVTKGTYEDGDQFVLSDYWRASRRPDGFPHRKWKGSTGFIPSPGRGSKAPHSAARLLTPRSPGNPRPREEVKPVQEMKPRWVEADEPACGSSVKTPRSLRP